MDRTILLVDHATRTRELMGSILQMRGYTVLKSGDGRDALERLRRGRPDLLIIEAMIPVQSGFEVCAAVRRDPNLKDLPILMMSSLTRLLVRDDGHWRQHVTADEFLTRPFCLTDLLSSVEKLIGSAEALSR